MKESLIPVFEDLVVKIEDDWVNEQWKIVDQLERRAKSSNTIIAWNEFHSAAEKLDQELERLVPQDHE